MASRPRPETYLFFGVCFALIVFVSHAPLLALPYHWDELGYFVPAALDLYQQGLWVPVSTLANVHPPGLAAYLTTVWTIAGYSVEATRVAMLLVAVFSVLAAFLLGIELTRSLPGYPAFAAVALLLLSPLFFTQSMMAQLDLPAMLFSTVALLWFLQNRTGWCVVACTILTLVKETGLVAPLVFALWLAKDRRWKEAAFFTLPAAALGAWLLVLLHSTGNPAGNAEFAWYNLVYPLHPVRLGGALLRRASYLFVEEFRCIGTVALVLAWRRGVFSSRSWRIAGSFALAQTLFVTVFGGAVLERYLLPVLPILYTAFSVSIRGRVVLSLVAAGLFSCNFWNPPLWPFPQENNLAMVNFVRVQQDAAAYLDATAGNIDVVTAWPFSDALRRPEFGYVTRPLRVHPIEDFSEDSLRALPSGSPRLLAIYSRDWDPPHSLLHHPVIESLWRRYFRYRPPVSPGDLRSRFGFVPLIRRAHGGQWIEIWQK